MSHLPAKFYLRPDWQLLILLLAEANLLALVINRQPALWQPTLPPPINWVIVIWLAHGLLLISLIYRLFTQPWQAAIRPAQQALSKLHLIPKSQYLPTMVSQLARQSLRLEHQRQQAETRLLLLQKQTQQTGRKLNQVEQLYQTESRNLSLILQGITDAVIAVDKQQQIAIFNPAAEQLTGHSRKYALDKKIDQVLSLWDQDSQLTPKLYLPWDENAHGVVFNQNNIKLIGANHKTAYVNLIVAQVNHQTDTAIGHIITLHDITREHEFQRMKLDFASMAAHELRTPLTTVQGYLSFLQNPQTLDKLNPQEQDFLTKAQTSALRLNKLIENVLAVSKIENGKLTIKPQPLQMTELIQKLVTEYTGLAQTKTLTLSFVPPQEPMPQVMADSMRIEEVLSNLIGNAIKYTNKGGVEISLKQQGEYLITSVVDTGPGIPPEAIPKLFTKFYRVQGKLDAGTKGTGLGLYISKMIVEAHHGKIWAESIPGQGANFSFSLPIVKPKTDKVT